MKSKLVNNFIIGTFVSLYLLVSIISTIHVIDFFELSNPKWLAISLAIGFEIGAAASLASLIALEKMNKSIVWALFITITAMQMQGNMYYAFINLQDYNGWVELFNLVEWEPLAQKRLLSAVSGAILPLVALGFIKSLVDYIKPDAEVKEVVEHFSPGIEEAAEEELTDEEVDEIIEDFNNSSVDWNRMNDLLSDEELEDFEIEFEDEDEDEIFEDDYLEDTFDAEEAALEESEKAVQALEDEVIDEILRGEEFEIEVPAEEAPIEAAEEIEESIEETIEAPLQAEPSTIEKVIEQRKPTQDIDATYKFGTNLYNTMLKKMNSDHLQPSVEEVTKAYKNLGLVNKPKE